jgi:hypothetical protein
MYASNADAAAGLGSAPRGAGAITKDTRSSVPEMIEKLWATGRTRPVMRDTLHPSLWRCNGWHLICKWMILTVQAIVETRVATNYHLPWESGIAFVIGYTWV